MATEPTRSPPVEMDGLFPPPPPPPHNTPEYAASTSSVTVDKRHDLAAVVAKAEKKTAAPGEWYSWSGQRDAAPARGSRVVTGIVNRGRLEGALQRTAVGARIAAAALCLVALSVLAADKDKGWALDSYNRYKQFRYCMSVNVIGFLYSGFQLYAQVHHIVMEQHIIRRPMGDYFDFAMDQILAYLLVSSSSSATARTDDWVSNWGSDEFPNMAIGSASVSFLAFLVFALSALISAHNLFSRNP